jgi:hypothetical protein
MGDVDAAESFWVIPDVAKIRTPAAILREQAALLTKQTRGTLVGVVETSNVDNNMVTKLAISVPSLNDYRYNILTYRQPVEMYPGILDSAQSHTVNNEEQFITHVRQVLSSDRIRNVIGSLLSQATGG